MRNEMLADFLASTL